MFYVEKETEEDIDMKSVNSSLKAITDFLGERRDFSVTFVSDEEISALNREYRNMDNPTDILTFRLDDGEDFPIQWEEGEEPEDEELGDIFISLESMRRNAMEFGCTEEEELKRLLIHGVLHLRGLDHATNDFSTEPMLKEQEEIMVRLGFRS